MTSLGAGPLFPQFKLDRDGRRGTEASHKIGEFVRDECGVKDLKKAPNHGWRHFVTGKLRDAGVRLDVAYGITGHGNASRTEHWAYGEYVQAMRNAIERLPNPLAKSTRKARKAGSAVRFVTPQAA